MSIAAGTGFGHYEIAAAIGAGGMGEVYRAKDTSLKRDVALKILPQAFAADADRVARFQREAEALAAIQDAGTAGAVPTSITADGRALIGGKSRGVNGDIWVLRLGDAVPASADAAAAELGDVLATEFNERDAALSPEGHFLAYASNESGRDEVYVVPYPGPGGKTQVSTGGGRLPHWNPNGRELFYVSGTSVMAVDVETSPVFRRLTPKVLFEAPALANFNLFYAVAPDGSWFLLAGVGAADADQSFDLRIVVNWFEELRALAPWPER
jgi:hypothetical protein